MSRPKLLLADDSVTIRKVVELTFADEGVDVSTAGDAETAMQKFVDIQPDIVLVDVGLEGTSGYQICEMIKADDATRDIPVLLLVGSFEPFDQDEAERVGADGFLTKPFHSIRDLVARVTDLLGNSASASTATGPEVAEHGFEFSPSDSNIPITRDADDIDSLYNQSFAETVEIDEYDTVDDMLGDPALDDEMIETSHPAGKELNGTDQLPATEVSVETTKNFDWSTESVPAQAPPVPADSAFEPKFVFDDSTEGVAVDAAASEGDSEPERADAGEPESEPDLDAPAGNAAEEGAEASSEVETPVEEPPMEDEPVGEVQADAAAEPEVWPEVDPTAPQVQFSPELINMLADRIVEKLSDRVIREVAQEAVPRIAEKLIREALDDNGQKS